MSPIENLTKVTWIHPSNKEIAETVCDDHEQQLLKALRFLGIGCSGEESDSTVCIRCQFAGYDFRKWMHLLNGS